MGNELPGNPVSIITRQFSLLIRAVYKKDVDRLMRENELAALWIVGPTNHNPCMHYFTGGHHIAIADLIKPVLFHSSLEREEASATGLKTVSFDR